MKRSSQGATGGGPRRELFNYLPGEKVEGKVVQIEIRTGHR